MRRQANIKPPWLKVTAFGGSGYEHIRSILKEQSVNTVCQEANCPNRGECFNAGTATFMILGSLCSRNCPFCNVESGRPKAVDQGEPQRVAKAAAQMKLSHVVITSVTRDDLSDGGAGQFVKTVKMIRSCLESATVELLIPDFGHSEDALAVVLDCVPEVINHNLETVARLYEQVRPSANYRRSLDLLKRVSDDGRSLTKSGLMVGLGESRDELIRTFEDLSTAGIDSLTIGQYLSPSKEHLPVDRFLDPTEFESLAGLATRAGIGKVVSGPLVRSSYKAGMALVPH